MALLEPVTNQALASAWELVRDNKTVSISENAPDVCVLAGRLWVSCSHAPRAHTVPHATTDQPRPCTDLMSSQDGEQISSNKLLGKSPGRCFSFSPATWTFFVDVFKLTGIFFSFYTRIIMPGSVTFTWKSPPQRRCQGAKDTACCHGDWINDRCRTQSAPHILAQCTYMYFKNVTLNSKSRFFMKHNTIHLAPVNIGPLMTQFRGYEVS